MRELNTVVQKGSTMSNKQKWSSQGVSKIIGSGAAESHPRAALNSQGAIHHSIPRIAARLPSLKRMTERGNACSTAAAHKPFTSIGVGLSLRT